MKKYVYILLYLIIGRLYQNKLLKDGTYHYELSYEEGLPYISISGNGVKRYFLLLSN